MTDVSWFFCLFLQLKISVLVIVIVRVSIPFPSMWHSPRVLLTYAFMLHVLSVIPSSLIILIMAREADDSYTHISCSDSSSELPIS